MAACALGQAIRSMSPRFNKRGISDLACLIPTHLRLGRVQAEIVVQVGLVRPNAMD
jgi:hypothetical protein